MTKLSLGFSNVLIRAGEEASLRYICTCSSFSVPKTSIIYLGLNPIVRLLPEKLQYDSLWSEKFILSLAAPFASPVAVIARQVSLSKILIALNLSTVTVATLSIALARSLVLIINLLSLEVGIKLSY